MSVVNFTFNLRADFHQEGPWVIATFPDLDITSQGRTKEEAARNLIEAAQLFIESCFERNTLDEVLKSCGFVPSHGQSPADGGEHLTVPFELLAARNGSAARAC